VKKTNGLWKFNRTCQSRIGHIRAQHQLNEQRSFYQEQTSINRAIGNFNEEVARRAGLEAVDGIALMTRRMIGKQRAAFAGSGVSGDSPMMIVGETITMGSKQAQEAYFNSEVEAVNIRYKTYSAVSQSENAASSAKHQALQNTIGMAKQLLSLGEIGQYQKSTGVAPNFNIFKYWQK
jgi:hypothetical protein